MAALLLTGQIRAPRRRAYWRAVPLTGWCATSRTIAGAIRRKSVTGRRAWPPCPTFSWLTFLAGKAAELG
jgi:hypothetical protein